MAQIIELIDRAVRAHFSIVDEGDKPLQTDRNFDESVGMASTVFVGLCAHYGVPWKDVELWLAVTKEERETKYRRIKEHLLNGRGLNDMLNEEGKTWSDYGRDELRMSAAWRHFIKFGLCRNYIENNLKRNKQWITARDIFGH